MNKILSIIILEFSLLCFLHGTTPQGKDLAWFPKEVAASKPLDCKRFDIAKGVEYGYVFCEDLFGHPGDIHAVKINLSKAPIRPFINEGSLIDDKNLRPETTSAAAKKSKALFAINGGFFKWSSLIPYYSMKINGEMVESIVTNATMGLAFSNDGKKVKVGRVNADELATWDNYIAGEGLVHNGKCALDWKRPTSPKTKPDAPRTFLGMDTTNNLLYVFVTDGRKTGNNKSMGLSYFDISEIMLWFGCDEGVNIDGGGSSTLVVRKDALKTITPPYTPEAHPSKNSEDYIILNATSDGNERRVLDHILFLETTPSQMK